jgi:hypothetical protein
MGKPAQSPTLSLCFGLIDGGTEEGQGDAQATDRDAALMDGFVIAFGSDEGHGRTELVEAVRAIARNPSPTFIPSLIATGAIRSTVLGSRQSLMGVTALDLACPGTLPDY